MRVTKAKKVDIGLLMILENLILDNLINFRSNNILSEGLDDQTNAFNFKIYASLISEIPEEYVINNLPKQNIGNSKSLIKFKNVFIDYNKEHIFIGFIPSNKKF